MDVYSVKIDNSVILTNTLRHIPIIENDKYLKKHKDIIKDIYEIGISLDHKGENFFIDINNTNIVIIPNGRINQLKKDIISFKRNNVINNILE